MGDGSNPFYKRQANKTVRRYKGLMSDGKWYRKLYCSWNIKDYNFYWPEEPSAYRK